MPILYSSNPSSYGGGGGGGGGETVTNYEGSGGGGGGAGQYVANIFDVTPNEILSIEVGDGGAGGSSQVQAGSAGNVGVVKISWS